MSEHLTNGFEEPAGRQVVLTREVFDRSRIEARADELLAFRERNEYLPLSDEAGNNAVTALFEELTAAGDLSVLRFDGDQNEVHRDTLARLLNGFYEGMPEWERRRRYAEICEELQVQEFFVAVSSGELSSDSLLFVVSDFPDDAPSLDEAHGIGYRAGNRKGMLRSYHFEQGADGSWTRVLEQLSRSNSTDGSTRDWFNINASAVPLHSTGALHESFIAGRGRLPDGIVTLVDEMDGSDRLYGEPVHEAVANGRPGYESLRSVSLERRRQLEKFTSELAMHEQRLLNMLHKGEITYAEKLNRYYKKQDEIVDRIAIMDSDYARDSRGEASVVFYQQAGFALLAGDEAGFHANLHTAHRVKDKHAGGACGGRGAETANDNPYDNPEDAGNLYEKSKQDAKDWKWKDGVCRVPSCRKKTKVGPCSVCRPCQKRFDRGEDPTKDPLPGRASKARKTGLFMIGLAEGVRTT